MYGLFECMSSGCVAQKGDHAKISCQVIQGWDRTFAGHLKPFLVQTNLCFGLDTVNKSSNIKIYSNLVIPSLVAIMVATN